MQTSQDTPREPINQRNEIDDTHPVDDPYLTKQLRAMPADLDDSLHVTLARMKKSPTRRGGRRKDAVVKNADSKKHFVESCPMSVNEELGSSFNQFREDSESS